MLTVKFDQFNASLPKAFFQEMITQWSLLLMGKPHHCRCEHIKHFEYIRVFTATNFVYAITA